MADTDAGNAGQSLQVSAKGIFFTDGIAQNRIDKASVRAGAELFDKLGRFVAGGAVGNAVHFENLIERGFENTAHKRFDFGKRRFGYLGKVPIECESFFHSTVQKACIKAFIFILEAVFFYGTVEFKIDKSTVFECAVQGQHSGFSGIHRQNSPFFYM